MAYDEKNILKVSSVQKYFQEHYVGLHTLCTFESIIPHLCMFDEFINTRECYVYDTTKTSRNVGQNTYQVRLEPKHLILCLREKSFEQADLEGCSVMHGETARISGRQKMIEAISNRLIGLFFE